MPTAPIELQPERGRRCNGSHHPQLVPLLLQQGPLLNVQLHKGSNLALGNLSILEDLLQK